MVPSTPRGWERKPFLGIYPLSISISILSIGGIGGIGGAVIYGIRAPDTLASGTGDVVGRFGTRLAAKAANGCKQSFCSP